MDSGYIVRWQSDLVYTIESVLPVCDKHEQWISVNVEPCIEIILPTLYWCNVCCYISVLVFIIMFDITRILTNIVINYLVADRHVHLTSG